MFVVIRGLEPKEKLYNEENILKMDFKIYTILPKIFPGCANISRTLH